MAGVISLISSLLFAGALAAPTETYKDIIEKAQMLTAQKERVHAVQLLTSSISRESKKSQPPKELAAALEDIATLFLNDQAQQQYELALSLHANDPQAALAKIAEAARLEPDNLAVVLEQMRLHLAIGNCGDAAALAQKFLEALTLLESVRLVQAQVLMCKGQSETVLTALAGFDARKSPFAPAWQSLQAEALLRQKKADRALELFAPAVKVDLQFPETFYWKWRTERDLKKNSEESGQKYLSACKALSARLFRQYIFEPQLCRHLQEVESSLKKMNNPPS